MIKQNHLLRETGTAAKHKDRAATFKALHAVPPPRALLGR
jgi:hypothetical protein